MRSRRPVLAALPVVVLVLAPVLVLAGCAGTGGSPATPASAGSSGIRVVASTDVWGDIVRQIGGSDVSVDSLITDPDRDPHEYQSDPRDQLAVARAQLVVVNGGGYDDFLERLLDRAPASTEVIDAAKSSGLDARPAGGFNEHLWYDYPVVDRIAVRISAALTAVAPARKAAFAARLARFRSALAGLEHEEAVIRAAATGKGVAITEPVPLYLTAALGLVNRTPPAFSAAIEQGDDVAPAVLLAQLNLLRGKKVAVLAYNEQTTGATTEQVLAAAKRAGVPVVGVRETLPTGQDYLTWMRSDLAAMRAAVAG